MKEGTPHGTGSPRPEDQDHSQPELLQRALARQQRREVDLRDALAREEELLRQKDEAIQFERDLRKESEHRLLNGLQMIASLLALQSRASADGEVTSQLAVAAGRVAAIERVHRRLHALDGLTTVAFRAFLEDFCRDYSLMLSREDRQEQAIAVEGSDVDLPTATAIPLSFIVNELVTNAAKYGEGPIAVRLDAVPGGGYALSVSNDGGTLPDGFDPATSTGLGMTIVRAFVESIGGNLRFGRNDNDRGARFTVLFS
jgi:two-component system, sensor histidine kinase PdtaS